MYESFFGLARRPFAATPDPDCLVPVPTAERARDALSVCLERGQGVAVLTAAPGLGKTLLLRRLARDFAGSCAVVLLPRSDFTTRRSFLQAVLCELGQPYARLSEQELRLELERTVREIRPAREAVLLLLDEAHGLGDRVLEEVRNSTLLACDGQPLFRVVLCGQPELEDRLADPALAALNQRVACHEVLEPLTRDESREYLAARLEWAGARLEDCFEPEAVDLVCRVSDGIPRCLNHLADHSLLLAFVDEQRPVPVEIVRQALDDLRRLPLPWNEPLRADTPAPESHSPEIPAPETHFETGTNFETDEDDLHAVGATHDDRRSLASLAAGRSDAPDADDLIVDDLFDVSSAWDRDDTGHDLAAEIPHDDRCHVLEVGELADERTAWFAHPTDDVPETRRTLETSRATDIAAAPVDEFDRLEVRKAGAGPERTGLLLTADPWAPGGTVEFGTFFDGDDDGGDDDEASLGGSDAAARFEVPDSDLASLGAGGDRPANPQPPAGRSPHGPIAGPPSAPHAARARDARPASRRDGARSEESFEDVPVVDRYARLDAGLSVDDLPTESWRRIVAGTTEPRAVSVPRPVPTRATHDVLDAQGIPEAGSRLERLPQTAARDDWSVSDPLVAPERTAACDVLVWPGPTAEPESSLEPNGDSEEEAIDALDPIALDEPRGGSASTAEAETRAAPDRTVDPLAAWDASGDEPNGRRLSRRRLDGFLRLLDEALAAVVEPDAELQRDTIFPEETLAPDLEAAEPESPTSSATRPEVVRPTASVGEDDLEDRVPRDMLDVCRETRALVAGLESAAFRTADGDPDRRALPPRFDVVEPERDETPADPHAPPQRRYARLFSLLRGRRPSA